MFQVGDPIVFNGREKPSQEYMDEYTGIVIDVKTGNRPTRYKIRLDPKDTQPNGKYPTMDEYNETIVYDDDGILTVWHGIRPSIQIFEPLEEGEPKVRVTQISEKPYYRFLGKNIEKNEHIKEIEEYVKNINEECKEKIDIEILRLNAELELQYSLKHGKKRFQRTNSGGSKRNKGTKRKGRNGKRVKTNRTKYYIK
jgi:hypothetical protein